MDAEATQKAQSLIENYYIARRASKSKEQKDAIIIKLASELNLLGFSSITAFFRRPEALIAQGKMVFATDLKDCKELLIRVGECDNCGVCCVKCKHYQKGVNCTIYKDRPEECRIYPTVDDLLNGCVPKECKYSIEKAGIKQLPLNEAVIAVEDLK